MRVEVDSSKLTRALKSLRGYLQKEISIAAKKLLTDIQETARADHEYTPRSGNADRGISVKVYGRVTRDGTIGKVFLNTGVAKYLPYLHEGTGIYGKYGRPITPKTAKVLRWVNTQSGKWFSKGEVKGIKKDQFLYRASKRVQPKVKREISAGIRRAIIKAGLS